MDYRFAPAKTVEGKKVGQDAHIFTKLALIKVEHGDRKGTIVGTQVVARCEVGGGPKQLSVAQLKGVMDGVPFIVTGPEGRVDARVVMGDGRGDFTKAELEEILEKVDKKGPGRPKKDA